MNITMGLETLFKEMNEVKSINTLMGLTEEFIQSVAGLTNFTYIVSHYANQFYKPFVITHYSKELIKLFEEKNYVSIDPTLKDMLTKRLPFCWDYEYYLLRGLSDKQHQMFLDYRNHNIVAGVIYPLRGFSGEIGGICFDLENKDDFINNRYAVNQWDLMCFSIIYHETVSRLSIENSTKSSRQLSSREAECLKWSAQGKTAWEISIILGLTEQTIETYLKTSLNKLNASNKTHAVVKALLQGYLVHQAIDWSNSNLISY